MGCSPDLTRGHVASAERSFSRLKSSLKDHFGAGRRSVNNVTLTCIKCLIFRTASEKIRKNLAQLTTENNPFSRKTGFYLPTCSRHCRSSTLTMSMFFLLFIKAFSNVSTPTRRSSAQIDQKLCIFKDLEKPTPAKSVFLGRKC